MTLSSVIIIAALLSWYHYLIESTIAPNIRFWLRSKLFKIRDRLVELKAENQEKIDSRLFDELYSSINFSIANLPNVNTSTIIKAKKLQDRSEAFQKEFNAVNALFEKCEIQELKKIRLNDALYLSLAIFTNSLGWALYVLPILILAFVILVLVETIKSKASQFVLKVMVVINKNQSEFISSQHYGVSA